MNKKQILAFYAELVQVSVLGQETLLIFACYRHFLLITKQSSHRSVYCNNFDIVCMYLLTMMRLVFVFLYVVYNVCVNGLFFQVSYQRFTSLVLDYWIS